MKRVERMSIMKRITAKVFVVYVSSFLCFYVAFTHKNRKQLKEDDFESNEEEIQIAWPRETNEQYSHTSKFFFITAYTCKHSWKQRKSYYDSF